MGRRSIWIIISLMSLALIGLVSFQLYWINNAIKLSEERFEKDVFESMHRVSEKLERQEMANVAANSFAFFEAPTGTTAFSSTSLEVVIADGDTLRQQVFSTGGTYSQTLSAEWVEGDHDRDVNVVGDVEPTEQVREVHESPKRKVVIKSNSRVGDSTVVVDLQRVKRKREQFNQIVEELILPELDVLHRVHPQVLDSLITTELHERGIDIHYEFGVMDEFTGKVCNQAG